MKILAFDTSCDDTAAAIVERRGKQVKILSNVVASQVKVHQQYGGVFPMLAKREHQKNLVVVLKKALQKSGLLVALFNRSRTISNFQFSIFKKILKREPEMAKRLITFLEKYKKPAVKAIAVTVGPGLEPCLWQGINFARALAYFWDLPIIPVNHIEAHLLANFFNPKLQTTNCKLQTNFFPAIGLVVSGGHTQLVLVRDVGQYKIIGETRDDAAGECLDKAARILGLPYPGGPAIAAKAAQFSIFPSSSRLRRHYGAGNFQFSNKLPRPMINSGDYDFSFSGLKTAVLYEYRKQKKAVRESKQYQTAMALEIQQAIIDVLVAKTIKAAKAYWAKSILLAGGVAANKELRKQLAQRIKKEKLCFMFHAPCLMLCTDNAAMIGITGFFNLQYKKGKQNDWRLVKAKPNLRIC